MGIRTLQVMLRGFRRLEKRIIELDHRVSSDRIAGAVAALDFVITSLYNAISKGAKVENNLTAQAEESHAQVEEIIFEHFGKVLACCLMCPRTALTPSDFDLLYGNMHCSPIWNKACQRYHMGSSDPLCKSDAFLKVMHTIYCLLRLPTT